MAAAALGAVDGGRVELDVLAGRGDPAEHGARLQHLTGEDGDDLARAMAPLPSDTRKRPGCCLRSRRGHGLLLLQGGHAGDDHRPRPRRPRCRDAGPGDCGRWRGVVVGLGAGVEQGGAHGLQRGRPGPGTRPPAGLTGERAQLGHRAGIAEGVVADAGLDRGEVGCARVSSCCSGSGVGGSGRIPAGRGRVGHARRRRRDESPACGFGRTVPVWICDRRRPPRRRLRKRDRSKCAAMRTAARPGRPSRAPPPPRREPGLAAISASISASGVRPDLSR